MTLNDLLKTGIMLVLISGPALAQVPLPDYLGSEVGYTNARTLAGGGATGLEAGPASLFGNPAMLAFARTSAVEVGYGLKLASETRTRIVYDQFENSLGEVAIAENIHSSAIPGPLAGLYRSCRLAVGAGLAETRDFNYTYLKEYRDDFYIKTGEDRIEQSGGIYDAGLGAAYQLLDWLSVGARGSFRFGGRRLNEWQIRGADTSLVADTGTMSGIGFGAGLAARPVGRLTVAADFASGASYSGWSRIAWATPPAYLGRYPWSARLGLSYRVPGSLPSTVSAEARFQAWKTVDSTFSNLLVVRAGVEHTMLNFVSLRYGFGVEPQPFDPTIQRLNAAFGLGFNAVVVKIDVGMLFTHDLLGPMNFSAPLTENDLKIYGDRSNFAVTISRSF